MSISSRDNDTTTTSKSSLVDEFSPGTACVNIKLAVHVAIQCLVIRKCPITVKREANVSASMLGWRIWTGAPP